MAHALTLNGYAASRHETGLFTRLRQNLHDLRAYFATYDELNALSDRDLADLGVSRLNIRDVAREAVYGK